MGAVSFVIRTFLFFLLSLFLATSSLEASSVESVRSVSEKAKTENKTKAVRAERNNGTPLEFLKEEVSPGIDIDFVDLEEVCSKIKGAIWKMSDSFLSEINKAVRSKCGDDEECRHRERKKKIMELYLSGQNMCKSIVEEFEREYFENLCHDYGGRFVRQGKAARCEDIPAKYVEPSSQKLCQSLGGTFKEGRCNVLCQ